MIPNQAVSSYLHDQRQKYTNKVVYSWDGLGFSQRDTLRQIDFYKSSKFLDGDFDESGNELLFNNIVNAAAEVAKTYQDIDSKDLTLRATNGDYNMSRLINQENNKLKKDLKMGALVNDLTDKRVDYGLAILRKRMHKGKLALEVPELKDMIFDPEDMDRDAITQRSVITPATLIAKKGVWRNIDDILEKYYNQRQGDMGATLSNQIIIYETFGHLPENFGKDNGKPSEKFEDKVVISVGFKTIEANTVDNATEYQYVDSYFTVFDGPHENPFKSIKYKKIAGRSLGMGIIESGFNAQMAVNRAVYDQMIAMTIAGKVVLQTASEELDAESIADVENGAIIRHEVNRPITNLNLTPSALPQYDVLINQWKDQYDSISGNNVFTGGGATASQTSFKLAEFQNDIGTGRFKKRQEEMDIFLQEVYDDWIIPYLVSQITEEHILEGEFSKEELDSIDKAFATKQVDLQMTEYIKRTNRYPSVAEVKNAYEALIRNQRMNENRRYLKIPKGYFDGVKYKMDLNITNENIQKDAMMSSLTNMFQVLVQNPMALQDEQLSSILNEILEFAGISPMRINRQTPIRDDSIAAQVGPVSGSGSAAVANLANTQQ